MGGPGPSASHGRVDDADAGHATANGPITEGVAALRAGWDGVEVSELRGRGALGLGVGGGMGRWCDGHRGVKGVGGAGGCGVGESFCEGIDTWGC